MLVEMPPVHYRGNLQCVVLRGEQWLDSSPYFTRRVKVFRGRKVHGEFDIKVEQVGFPYVIIYIFCASVRSTAFTVKHIVPYIKTINLSDFMNVLLH